MIPILFSFCCLVFFMCYKILICRLILRASSFHCLSSFFPLYFDTVACTWALWAPVQNQVLQGQLRAFIITGDLGKAQIQPLSQWQLSSGPDCQDNCFWLIWIGAQLYTSCSLRLQPTVGYRSFWPPCHPSLLFQAVRLTLVFCLKQGVLLSITHNNISLWLHLGLLHPSGLSFVFLFEIFFLLDCKFCKGRDFVLFSAVSCV